ncbi:Aste57867_672 [Aphanomyces stellatus]|uniref:Aste57867_672 protein n=1 Tax=Aphanomyces stellatus TaxID=120398 RepID=A0A485K482_9STRA|nr:hypothetical protein As57867_000671 [Aphanomyces stellatus]VFT77897.1 Aste57867_672 [Aphanomyces stellatus]
MALLRNRSSKGDVSGQKIVLSGWMRKQKAHLKTWSRRFFALSGSTLSYYDSEDITGNPRGILDVSSVHPLPSEPNGLLIHCKAGRDEKLICDTNVAYNAWFALLTRATTPDVGSPTTTSPEATTSSSDADRGSSSADPVMSRLSSDGGIDDPEADAYQKLPTYHPNPIKMGYVHVHYASTASTHITNDAVPAGDADSWNRYFCKVEHDLLNCYSDETQQNLYVSGMVRNVSLYEGRKYALAVGLNKSRTVILCCDSMEEKTNWLLTLEGALKTAYKVIQARRQQGGGSSAMLKRASSHIYDLDLEPEEQTAALAAGGGATSDEKLLRVDEDSDDGAAEASYGDSEASGVWI